MKQVIIEWDIESVDEHDNIQDHRHSDTLDGFSKEELNDLENHGIIPDAEGLTHRLVLVRDVFTDQLMDRAWAYVDPDTGSLSGMFMDCNMSVTAVPKKYLEEFTKHFGVMEIAN